MRALGWIASAFAALWALLFVIYTVQHPPCIPMFSRHCGSKAWETAGWSVQFGWVKDWGGFVGALLALGAALLGARYLNRQIQQSEEHEIERRVRREAALRAGLPASLSSVCRYCEANMKSLASLSSHAVDGAIPTGTPIADPEVVPQEQLMAIRDMIGELPIEKSRALARLLAEIQVSDSRMYSLKRALLSDSGEVTVVYQVYDYMTDVADIYARAAALFDYARNCGPLPDEIIQPAQVISALFLMRIDDVAYPVVYDLVRRVYPLK